MVSVVTVMLLAVRTERMSCMLLRLTNGEVAKAMPNPIKRRNTDPCNLHGQIAGFQCLRIPVDDANRPNTRVLNPDALPKPQTHSQSICWDWTLWECETSRGLSNPSGND